MNEVVFVGRHQLTHNVPYHKHSTWEFIYCTGGCGSLHFDGDTTINYCAGDMVIIPENIPHSNKSGDGFTNIHLNISSPSLSLNEPVCIKDDSEKHIYETCNDLLYFYNSTIKRKSLVISSLCTLLMSYITIQQESSEISEIVQEIASNILNNFPDCYYDLNNYLKQFPFNNDYLRKLFKREMGVTPNQYLIDKRLQTSADIIRSMYCGSNNISIVANSCGFKDPLYFSRMFKKKYGISPTMFAKDGNIHDKIGTSEDQKIIIAPD